MKTTFKSFMLLAAFSAFAATSCSQSTQDKAEATADSAAADASNAADNVEADMAPERGDTAVVQNREADKLVEETSEKQ